MSNRLSNVPVSSLEAIDALGQVIPFERQPFIVKLTSSDGIPKDEPLGTQRPTLPTLPTLQHEELGGGAHSSRTSRRKPIEKYIGHKHGVRLNDTSGHSMGGGRLSAPIMFQKAASQPSVISGANSARHLLVIEKGENILSKILALSEGEAKVVTILSAYGTVSSVTLRRPYPFPDSVTYEGLFDIITLSGLYLPLLCSHTAGFTGKLNISLNGGDGITFGGNVEGPLVAASKTQVMVWTFTYGGPESGKKLKVANAKLKQPLLG